jgi:hypothetical protein
MRASASIYIMAATFLFSGCQDRVQPHVHITSPEPHFKVLSGNDILVKADLSDDKNLASYRIAVDAIEDPHKVQHPIDPFSYLFEEAISGESFVAQRQVSIPVAVAAGRYLITVTTVDKKDNSGVAEVEIEIRNSTDTVLPFLLITTLSDTSVNVFDTGDTISIEGTATDDTELASIVILMADASDHTVYSADPHLAGTSQGVDHDVPAPTTPGTYHLHVSVHDKVNNVYTLEFDLLVQ